MERTNLKWNEFQKASYIAGEDHLGILNVGIQISDRLQTGITSITPRARYWSFYTWVLYDFIENMPHRSDEAYTDYLHRQDWFYILANIAEMNEREQHETNLVQVTKGQQAWQEKMDELPYNEAYYKGSVTGIQVYRNVLRSLHLTSESDFVKGVLIPRLTPKGTKLAEAFRDTIAHTRYYKEYRLSDKPVPRSVLLEYGQAAGLGRLLEPGAQDRQTLMDIFMPPDPQDELEMLRKESLHFYKFVFDHNGYAQPGSGRAWRNHMYDRYSPWGKDNADLPQEHQKVAMGWAIYQARQLFTFSLQTIWSYVLEIMEKQLYTHEGLLEEILNQMMIEKLPVDEPINSLLQQMPLDPETREEFIGHMTSKNAKTVLKVHQPLLVMLDVYSRMKNLDQNDKLVSQLHDMGGAEHLSLSWWMEKVEASQDLSVADFLKSIITHYILDQHQKVALGKALTTQNITYHFGVDEGKLHCLRRASPVFNVFRVRQGISVMKDLGLILANGNDD